MLLAVDVGNTNTVFAVHDGSSWVGQWRSSTDSTRTADDYAVWLTQMLTLQGLSVASFHDCVIASVVPQSIFNLRNLARRYFHVEPLVIGTPDVKLDIDVRTDNPSEVGADRLITAIGAHIKYPGPLIVVDSGTATTFDVVGQDGAFEGGAIAPGINLSVRALRDAAAQLPRIEIKAPPNVVGRNTLQAMQSGIFLGYIELIDGLIQRIKAEYGKPMTSVATGGVVSLFKGSASQIDHFDPDLTIRGLYEVYCRNADSYDQRRIID